MYTGVYVYIYTYEVDKLTSKVNLCAHIHKNNIVHSCFDLFIHTHTESALFAQREELEKCLERADLTLAEIQADREWPIRSKNQA